MLILFSPTQKKAKLIEEMFIEGFVNASSIWFMVTKRQEGNWNIIEQSELLERSIVVAWSNREALRQKNVDLYEKIDKSWLFEVSFKDCDCWDDEKETEEGKRRNHSWKSLLRTSRSKKFIKFLRWGQSEQGTNRKRGWRSKSAKAFASRNQQSYCFGFGKNKEALIFLYYYFITMNENEKISFWNYKINDRNCWKSTSRNRVKRG